MPTTAHFIDVGQGNMVLLELDDGTIMLYDCNVTNENETQVLNYLAGILGWHSEIDIFVNSHRDADHMRGIKKVHDYFPIRLFWDSGVTGGTPNSSEYQDYMDLRRRVGYKEIERRKRWTFGNTLIRLMNSKNEDLPNESNAQSIVIKVQHRDSNEMDLASILLTGDTDAITWKETIMDFYGSDVSSSILLASHHGSISFFDDPNDTEYYYTAHLKKISPTMTIISVGDNAHGHPDQNALKLYDKYSSGSDKGNKIKRTDFNGTIKVLLKDEGSWSLWDSQ